MNFSMPASIADFRTGQRTRPRRRSHYLQLGTTVTLAGSSPVRTKDLLACVACGAPTPRMLATSPVLRGHLFERTRGKRVLVSLVLAIKPHAHDLLQLRIFPFHCHVRSARLHHYNVAGFESHSTRFLYI